jgi:hypothetical protein
VVGMILILRRRSGNASFNNESVYFSPPSCRYKFSGTVRKKMLKELALFLDPLHLNYLQEDMGIVPVNTFSLSILIISLVVFILLFDFAVSTIMLFLGLFYDIIQDFTLLT